MDKNAIKKYAIWARNELIAKVSQKAAAYGIEKDNIVDANADSIDGEMLSSVEKKQRKALIEQINEKGYEQVIEEVAYTWFNRFTAIRFMEVNGYLLIFVYLQMTIIISSHRYLQKQSILMMYLKRLIWKKCLN